VALGSHMDWPGVCEDIRVYDNVYRGPGGLVQGRAVDVTAPDNVVQLVSDRIRQRFWYGFFRVPHALEEVKSDGNTYYAANPKTGEVIDLTEWLAKRREAGSDEHSRAAEPTLKSLNPNDPDFMVPAR
jgi:hypothetical protein